MMLGLALGRLLTLALALTVTVHAAKDPRQLKARRAASQGAHFERMKKSVMERAKKGAGNGVQNITFTNPAASAFYVDGTKIPEVDFDIGPSWAGLIPISAAKNETRQLFFWFFPPGPGGSLDDLLFWTNGGPGCSSLEGALQENGPLTWSWGQAKPTVNQFSWTNLSSILFVEQPIGTGYSIGTPTITNEDELAAQLVGFFVQWLEVFKELKGKKFYLSGESYAGTYVPYIANYIYTHPGVLDLNLQGFFVADPELSTDLVQNQIPAVPFVQKYANVFALNDTFMTHLEAQNKACGFDGYLDKFVTFPPKGLLPDVPGGNSDACDLWDEIFDAALLVNPAFNIYRIFDTFPILWDVLGFPGSFPQSQTLPLYFDRRDVKQALHVPTTTVWTECSNGNVFAGDGNDHSPPPAFSVLPSVIEKNNRTVIAHGLGDFILIAEGTRIVIQNMTWGGKQGFQTPIKDDSFIINGMGSLGTAHFERGLAYYEVKLSGHMIPQFSPYSAFRAMQFLMGFKSTISD